MIVVPLAEELAFRGYLTRRLIADDFQAVPEGRFTGPSFLVSSLLFGLLHQRWLAGTIAGMAYALVYYRRGKLIDAIAAHAIDESADHDLRLCDRRVVQVVVRSRSDEGPARARGLREDLRTPMDGVPVIDHRPARLTP